MAGLLIEAGQFSGTSSTASVSADGADTDYPGAGGRVAVLVESDDYAGQLSARSGDGRYATPGAGTVYRQVGTGDGTLIVDNAGNSSFEASTTLRSVGRHRIESITALPDNQWQIERERFKATFDGVLASANESGSIAYHSISVDEQTSIELILQRSAHTFVRVFRVDSDLGTDDRIASFNVTANDHRAQAFTADAGDYIVAIAPWATSEAQIVDGYNDEGISPYNYPGAYQLELQQTAVWTDSTGDSNGLGIAGLSVSLDAADEASPLYRIVSNTGHAVVVQSSDDLSVYADSELQGVHRFSALQVTGGASVSFGEDRVHLTGEQPLTVSEDSSLRVHEFSAQTLITIAQAIQPGRIEQYKMPDALESLTITGGEWAYDNVTLNSLTLQDGATLLSSDVSISGNMLMESGARLSVEPATASGRVLNTLNLSVDGTLEVASGAHIDLDAKGYPEDYRGPDFQYRQSSSYLCHGGRISADTACEYGSYISPQFAGSGGLSHDSDIGGGFAKVQAGSLILNGTISADSEGPTYSGAGGGLLISADNLSGGESGLISASAGSDSYRAGPGGRVSVNATVMDFQGQINVQTGASRQTLAEYPGAGTYYERTGVDVRRLQVDNGGIVSVRDGTTLPSVGRHVIASVEDLGNNQWRVQRQRFTRQFADELAAANEPGSIAYHAFELDRAMDVELSINSVNRASAQIFRDDGLLGSDDRVSSFSFNNSPLSSVTVSLEPGAYIVALAGQSTGSREFVDGYVSGEARSSRLLGSYVLEMNAASYWTSSLEANGGFGLQGLQVTLDADDESSPLFTVISNDVNSLVVQSSADLNANVGKQLLGVHEFDELQVTGGASVSFGDDRVHVRNMDAFVVDDTATLRVGEFSPSTQSALLSAPADGAVEVQKISSTPQTLTLASGEWAFDSLSVGSLTLQEGASLEVSQLEVTGNLVVQDGARLITNTANLGADVTLMPGAVLSVPDTDAATGSVSALELSVAGTLHVQQGAHIDLNGKGYPSGYQGPDFASGSVWDSCHGGRVRVDTACEYGSYRTPAFAGSGNASTDNAGGGYGYIIANRLIVDGSITADGEANVSIYGGAGGGLRLQANTFSGASGALITANGASEDYSGAGGRVSIMANSDDFAGDVQVKSGTGWRSPEAGAGTFYRQIAGTAGQLIVDNGGRAAGAGTTTVRNIGRHDIATALDTEDGNWRITRAHVEETFAGELAVRGQSGSIGYHSFSLDARTSLELSTSSGLGSNSVVYIYVDDGELDSSDRVYSRTVYPYQETVYALTLDAGRYIMAIAGQSTSADDMVAGYTNGALRNTGNSLPDYSIVLREQALWKHSIEANGGFSLQDLQVSLDAGNPDAPLYTVVSNDGYSLIVQSEDDLSAVAGQQMIGVHVLDQLSVTGGASLSFGDDRLHINDTDNFQLASTSSLQAAELTATTQQALLTQQQTGSLQIARLPDGWDNLTISNGTWQIDQLDLDTLRLVAGARLGSTHISAASLLSVGDSAQLNTQTLVVPTALELGVDATLTATTLTGQNTLDLSAGASLTTDALNFVGTLSSHATASVTAATTVVSGDLALSEDARLTTGSVRATGNLTLDAGSVLRGTTIGSNNDAMSSLDISIDGDLVVEAEALIDVDRLGFTPYRTGPNSQYSTNTNNRCHGGRITTTVDCEYGVYRLADLPGSGGSGNGTGGGRLNILTATLTNDGTISANGQSVTSRAPAGGAIHIQADRINGREEGMIRANGGSSTTPGAGGRVSLVVNSNDYSGEVQAQAGVDTDLTQGLTVPGAGTVFWQVGEASAGHLIVDNGGQASVSEGTSVRAVGRHTIEAISALSNGQWDISLSPLRYRFQGTLTPANTVGSIVYHSIDIPSTTTMRVTLTRTPTDRYDDVIFYRDDGSLDASDNVTHFALYGTGQSRTTTLAAGRYIVALTDWSYISSQVISGYPDNGVSSKTSTGEYDLTIESVITDTWTAVDASDSESGLSGLHVSLDVQDESSATYPIVSNTGNSLVIESTEDLSSYVGKELVGVHFLDKLTVQGGASLSFGDDQVRISGSLEGMVAEGAELSLGSFDSATYSRLFTSTQAGTINQQWLSGDTTLTLGGGTWNFDSLDIASLTLGDGAILVTDTLNVSEDLTLRSGSTLTLPDRILEDYSIPTMNVQVDGVLRIESGASINLDGKGYESGDGPDFMAAEYRCHGGRTNPDIACEYGNYQHAEQAGTGGSADNLYGGGRGRIQAQSIIIDGEISADALAADGISGAGAGGGLHIMADYLAGNGSITADGGSGMTPGAGGRISLDAPDSTSVALHARAGRVMSDGESPSVVANADASAGAGTVYQSQDALPGTLTIDNAGQASIAHGTSLPSVGRHVVESVESGDVGQWTITRKQFPIRQVSAYTASETDFVFHPLDLNAPASLTFDMESLVWWDLQVRVFAIDDATTLGRRIDSLSSETEEGVELARFDLDAGSYAVTVVFPAVLDSEIIEAFTGEFEPDLPDAEFSENAQDTDADYAESDIPVEVEEFLEFLSEDNPEPSLEGTGDTRETAELLEDDTEVATSTTFVNPFAEPSLGEARPGFADSYELTITEIAPWQLGEDSLAGLRIDLDLQDDESPLYSIVRSTSTSLTVMSEDDLSELADQPFIGVMRFKNLRVRQGAVLDLGGDKVIVTSPEDLAVGADASLSIGEFDDATRAYLLESPVSGEVD